MKDTINSLAAEAAGSYIAKFHTLVNIELRAFGKANSDIEFFLFHTRFGEILRKNIAAHTYDSALRDCKRYIPLPFKFTCADSDQAKRFLRIINDIDFSNSMKKKFSFFVEAKKITIDVLELRFIDA